VPLSTFLDGSLKAVPPALDVRENLVLNLRFSCSLPIVVGFFLCRKGLSFSPYVGTVSPSSAFLPCTVQSMWFSLCVTVSVLTAKLSSNCFSELCSTTGVFFPAATPYSLGYERNPLLCGTAPFLFPFPSAVLFVKTSPASVSGLPLADVTLFWIPVARPDSDGDFL